MAKRITQATFNEVVKENMDEFEMDFDEAVEDAMQQFKSQGVDLSNIVKALAMEGIAGEEDKLPPIVTTISSLAAIAEQHGVSEEPIEPALYTDIVRLVKQLATELLEKDSAPDHARGSDDGDEETPTPSGDEKEAEEPETTTTTTTKGTSTTTTSTTSAASQQAPPVLSQARILAAAKGAFPAILFACQVTANAAAAAEDDSNRGDLCNALDALAELLDGQPDLVSPPDPDMILGEVKENAHVKQLCAHMSSFKESGTIMHAGTRAIRHACTKHETNRQTFVAEGIIDLLLHTIETHADHPQAVAEAAKCLRALTKDDDLRVAFGKGHEHAKLMVTEHNALGRIMTCLASFTDDATTTAELCKTLAKLSVRNEYCQQIVDLGGLDLILPALAAHRTNSEVASSAMQVLGAIAGNDAVKSHIREVGGIHEIIDTMVVHQKRRGVVEKGCAALAALCLREQENAKDVVSYGGAAVLVRGMVMFPDALGLQKHACRALRNIAARNPDLRQPILHEGAEAVLNVAITKKKCHDDAKGALRDLGCEVQLTEAWTGKKGSLHH